MNDQPWSHLITLNSVVDMHRESIARFGGDPFPEPVPGCVESSLGAAWNAELYAAKPGSVPGLCFAGCLLFYLIRNHCFVDGNKRAAWAASMEVLRTLGLTVHASDHEAEEFCLDVITGRASVHTGIDVCLWLAPRLLGLPDRR
ncbi:MAG: Fic family protein [Acidobacteriaceae bacterium]|nr:Fic family protein [Acidobacteriaceae bacterium]